MSFRSEVFEQPEVFERLLASQADAAREIAETIRQRGIGWIFVAARGSSDNAALYGKYLWGSVNRLPVALAAPSCIVFSHWASSFSASALSWRNLS